jgi:hypothetical protein
MSNKTKLSALAAAINYANYDTPIIGDFVKAHGIDRGTFTNYMKNVIVSSFQYLSIHCIVTLSLRL